MLGDARLRSALPLDSRASRSRQGGPSFALRHRLLRALWGLIWLLLARWTHPLHGWRRCLLRLFGAKVGKGVFVAPSARIWYPPHVVLEDFAAIGDEADLYAMAPIRIGRYAVVSKRAHLCAGTHDIDDAHFQLVTAPIDIGDHAWIAAEAFVGPGVVVGEGAVLGARAATFKNLDAWHVYVGNPARMLRRREPRERADHPPRGWRSAAASQDQSR